MKALSPTNFSTLTTSQISGLSTALTAKMSASQSATFLKKVGR
jgi:hypothetical protein